MLPVLACPGWQVEPVVIDLGTGMREWLEIRQDGHIEYCGTTAERDTVLRRHGVDPVKLTEIDVEDGCE